MTPGGLYSSQSSTSHYPSNRLPLSATSRYGRSANSGASISSNDGKSPSLGTSPANGSRGMYLHDRKIDSGPSPKTIDHGKLFSHLQNESKGGTGTFMTRTTGRRPGGQDAVTWMEGVRVVSTAQNGQQANTTTVAKQDAAFGKGKTAQDLYGEYTVLPGGQSVPVDKEVVPLHEELTAIARALQSKVRFEKVCTGAAEFHSKRPCFNCSWLTLVTISADCYSQSDPYRCTLWTVGSIRRVDFLARNFYLPARIPSSSPEHRHRTFFEHK